MSCLGSEDARHVNEMFMPLTTVWLLGPSMIVEGSIERELFHYNNYNDSHSTSTRMVTLYIPAGLLTVIV